MTVRASTADWYGDLQSGKGSVSLGSGLFEGPYTFASRFEEGEGTNPEELIGAAHAGCFSMFLSSLLSKDGHTPNSVKTEAKVHLGRVDGAPTITAIELISVGEVPGIDDATFKEYASKAKAQCPVSKSLAAVDVISLDARLSE